MTLTDFGGFPPGAPESACAPTRLEDIQQVLRAGRPVRVRAYAHSMNGMSVPASDEVMLDMTSVRHVRAVKHGVVAVGAGLYAWDLDRYVRRFGWKMQVVNDGTGGAPSIGGFVAAGGIGLGTMFYGGFWESVRRLVLVDGTGRVHRLDRGDRDFPWLFGSLGTLGVVFEAELELVPLMDDQDTSPVPDTSSLPRGEEAVWPPHAWFTLFVPDSRRQEAVEHLNCLWARHPQAWLPRENYEYYVRHRRFHPPLLFPENTDFVAVGVWGDRPSDLDPYLALEEDFQEVCQRHDLRRYFQTELIRTPRPLASYVGETCAGQYRKVKHRFDPNGILNRPHPTAVDRPCRL